jgi:UDP-N-acetylmuramate dehydrogenase
VINIDDIKKFFRGSIALSEPLSNHTYIRIGGPADYYFEPVNREDAIAVITYLQRQEVQLTVIGRGSNLLVSDDGIRGAIVNLERGLKSMHIERTRVHAEAGITLLRFVEFCAQKGLLGVEMLGGIPGTIGGAIAMNAGAFGGEISDHLIDIEILRDGFLLVLKKDQVGFSYRHTRLQKNDVVLSASFEMPSGDPEEIMKIRNELILKRNRTQPTNLPNSGSMFKNPPGTFAAKLIEEAGLKGTRWGNAQISEKHANFIVNLGGATANDVMHLLATAQKTVRDIFEVTLELEVKLIGFPDAGRKELSV